MQKKTQKEILYVIKVERAKSERHSSDGMFMRCVFRAQLGANEDEWCVFMFNDDDAGLRRKKTQRGVKTPEKKVDKNPFDRSINHETS